MGADSAVQQGQYARVSGWAIRELISSLKRPSR